jgi:predicted ATPase/DNA-binding winged helix-turn-helix (wHTH) protein
VLGPQAANLVVALALAPGQALSSAALADEVWPDDGPTAPKGALAALVARLRRIAGDPGIIEAFHGGYRLCAPTDLQEDTWEGEPGTGMSNEELRETLIALASRTRATALRAQAFTALAEGRAETAAAAGAALAESSPYDDAVVMLRMRALASLGRSAEAMEVFAEYQARLRLEMGADVSPELANYHGELLRGTTERLAPLRRHLRIGVRRPMSALLGRDDDLAAVENLLQTHPLVTIQGPGGVGKTTLAQELAARSAGEGIGVAVVELAQIVADEDVRGALSQTLGVHGTSGLGSGEQRDFADAIAERLEGPTLLVLDNCEHVIDGAARAVAELLGVVPNLTVLATSRSPLGLVGEAVLLLDPLSVGDGGPAEVLFEERARAARPDVLLPPEPIARLVTCLDGLPLAIELAAARVRTMSVQEIADGLDDLFSLLTSTNPAVTARHQTLDAVIGWSWTLLTPEQRILARRCAVFPASFTAQAAQAMVPDWSPAQVRLGLEALADQSLLRLEEIPGLPSRLRMLETVKEYALRQATEAGDLGTARAGMATWAGDFAASAQRDLNGPHQPQAFAQMQLETQNLIAALRNACGEGGQPDPRTAAMVFAALGLMWMGPQVQSQAEGLASLVLALCRGYVPEPEDAESVVLALFLAGFGSGEDGRERDHHLDPEESRQWEDRAMLGEALAAGAPTPQRPAGWLRPAVLLVGRLSERMGPGEQLHDLLEPGLTSDDIEERVLAQLLAAFALENSGRIDEAIALGQTCYRTAQGASLIWQSARAALMVASVAATQNDPDASMQWARRADEALQQLGLDADRSDISLLMVQGALASGDIETARAGFTQLADSAGVGEFDSALVGRLGLAEVDLLTGETDSGLTELTAINADVDQMSASGLGPWTLIVKAACLAAHGLYRHPDAPGLADMAANLVRGLDQVYDPQRFDIPVLGTVIVGLAGYWTALTEPRAAQLLALAERLNSRQDMSFFRRAKHWDLIADIFGDSAEADARSTIEDMSVEDCALRAVDLARTIQHDRETRVPS